MKLQVSPLYDYASDTRAARAVGLSVGSGSTHDVQQLHRFASKTRKTSATLLRVKKGSVPRLLPTTVRSEGTTVLSSCVFGCTEKSAVLPSPAGIFGIGTGRTGTWYHWSLPDGFAIADKSHNIWMRDQQVSGLQTLPRGDGRVTLREGARGCIIQCG
ncbi:hypothetical protein GQ600_27178 [Phytophthora cactorum]|nr:hypothetical protein GQ600_27178 [Phytophthora cactorum]